MSTARRRPVACAAAVTTVALTVAACAAGAGAETTEGGTTVAGGATTVTFRLWDEAAAPAYEESFDAFTAQHPDIRVQVETVPRAVYREWLRLDLASGEMADVFWSTASTFGRYANSGDLIDIGDALGEDHDAWEESITDLYRRDGSLWGVPQVWDSVALYYNAELVEDAGVDPTELTWQPPQGEGQRVGPEDTLLDAARALTADGPGRHPGEDGFDAGSVETYGFNAEADLRAICVPFLAQNGARFRDAGRFAFATDEGEEAFRYLVDLVGVHHVAPSGAEPAPSAAETDPDGDPTRDLFVQQRLALFQSGSDDLRTVADQADFEWAVAPMVAGPEGRIGVVDGVAAVGNANSDNVEATTEVLRWLGSADGQAALANQGVALPAAVDAQRMYVDYWAGRGVDVQPFLDAAQEPPAPAPPGPDVGAGTTALTPILRDMFLGSTPVEEALQLAQEAGNAALDE